MQTFKVVLRHRGDGSMIYTSFAVKSRKHLDDAVRIRFTNVYMIARVS